jgi:chromosome partitioning protein
MYALQRRVWAQVLMAKKTTVARKRVSPAGPVVVSFVNLKGGVGKTALAVNFAAYCGQQGRRTLLIDLDPQTNATFSCIGFEEWQEHSRENGTVADLLGARRHTAADGARREATDVIRSRVFRNVDLIPSHLDLFTVDLDLAGAIGRETKLRRALTEVLPDYAIVVCDCPPNLTIPTQNALAMSSHYVVPVSPDYLSGIGVGLLVSRIRELGEQLEQPITHAGIVISRMGRPAQHRDQTIEAIRNSFGTLVLEQIIKERSAVAQSAEDHRPIFKSSDRAAIAEFNEVCGELLVRLTS